LEGTNAEQAAEIIEQSGIGDKLTMVKEFAAAAQAAVELSKG
jgi:succinyl-CoA synthetase beta subunit